MMFPVQCFSFSPIGYPLQQPGRFKTIGLPLTQIHGVVNATPCKKYSLIKCSSQTSFNSTKSNKSIFPLGEIAMNSLKPQCSIRSTLSNKAGYALTSEDDNTVGAAGVSFQDVLQKKFDALCHLTRPYSWINIIIAITSVSFLPIQSLADLTPTFFMGILKAIVPTIMGNICLVSINQICDVEIDKINKPYLPLASGELSMAAGYTIAIASALMSLALGFMSGSPPLLWAQILWFLSGCAYSLPLPLLRWKGHTFLAPMTVMIVMGLLLQIPFFIHIQQYVLGRPLIITRQIIFSTIIMCIFAIVNGLLKDLPDIEGDKKFGMQTLCVIWGKERVFWLCVYTMLIAYGGVVIIAGASSSFMLTKLVSVIGHSILASMLWLRSTKVDLDNFESTFNFYLFIWKLNYFEYFLIHFLR